MILNYTSEKDYLHHLEGLDESALLKEYYACMRLKRAIEARTKYICRLLKIKYCPLLVDIDHTQITRHDYYLQRILLRLEMFIKKQSQFVNELHDYYNPEPIRHANRPAVLNPSTVLKVYLEVMPAFARLEEIVSSLSAKTDLWMHYLYNRRDIPDAFKTEECRRKYCAVNPDGSYDFKYQLELVYKELVWVLDREEIA